MVSQEPQEQIIIDGLGQDRESFLAARLNQVSVRVRSQCHARGPGLNSRSSSQQLGSIEGTPEAVIGNDQTETMSRKCAKRRFHILRYHHLCSGKRGLHPALQSMQNLLFIIHNQHCRPAGRLLGSSR